MNSITRFKIFTCVFLFFLTLSYAQGLNIGDIVDPNRNNRDLWGDGGRENIIGSPYLLDEWMMGEIKTKSGAVYPNIKIKYAAYSDQLFFLSENGDERTIAREKVQHFQFNDNDGNAYLFKHIPYHGFLLNLASGDVSLFKKIVKEIKEAPEPNGYNSSVGQAEFILRETYYISPSKDGIVQSVSNKKEFVSLFPDLESKISKYIKQNKVRFKKDEKIIGLVNYTASIKN
ncbi:hypothetical protein [Ekhidna sp.]